MTNEQSESMMETSSGTVPRQTSPPPVVDSSRVTSLPPTEASRTPRRASPSPITTPSSDPITNKAPHLASLYKPPQGGAPLTHDIIRDSSKFADVTLTRLDVTPISSDKFHSRESDAESLSPTDSAIGSSPESCDNLSPPLAAVTNTDTPQAVPAKRRPGRPPGSTRRYKAACESRRKSAGDGDEFSLRKFFEAGGRDYNEYLDWLKKRGQQPTNGMVPQGVTPQPPQVSAAPLSPAMTTVGVTPPGIPAPPYQVRSMFVPRSGMPPVVMSSAYRPMLIPAPNGMRPSSELRPLPSMTTFKMMPTSALPQPVYPAAQPQPTSPVTSPVTSSSLKSDALDLSAKKRKSTSSDDEDFDVRKSLREERLSPHSDHVMQDETPKRETDTYESRDRPRSLAQLQREQVELAMRWENEQKLRAERAPVLLKDEIQSLMQQRRTGMEIQYITKRLDLNQNEEVVTQIRPEHDAINVNGHTSPKHEQFSPKREDERLLEYPRVSAHEQQNHTRGEANPLDERLSVDTLTSQGSCSPRDRHVPSPPRSMYSHISQYPPSHPHSVPAHYVHVTVPHSLPSPPHYRDSQAIYHHHSNGYPTYNVPYTQHDLPPPPPAAITPSCTSTTNTDSDMRPSGGYNTSGTSPTSAASRLSPITPAHSPEPGDTPTSTDIDMTSWDVEHVTKFIASVPGCQEYVDTFREHRIDGATLPHLSEDHLLHFVKMKLGPAIHLRLAIQRLRSQPS